jgi:hypothetical protein
MPLNQQNYHKFLATILLGTFILQSCSTTTFERNMREETHVYTGTTTIRAQGEFKIKFEEVYASKEKNNALSLGIRYLNNTKFKKANEYMEYSCSVMSKLSTLFEDTEEAYKPWVRYLDVLNKVKVNYVGDSEQFRIFQKNLNHILDGLLLENGKVDINALDWRIHRKLAGSRKTLPENIAQKISEEKVLENFKIQIDKALDQLIWHEDTDRVNFTRSTLESLKDYCTEITNEESKNELIQSIISGRLDKYNEEEKSGYKFLNHTAILGEDGGLYLLLNSIDEEIKAMLSTAIDPKYLDDKVKKTKSDGTEKIVLGAGSFGKVRFALSLFAAKASPADIICVKKTKNFAQLNDELRGKQEYKPTAFEQVTDVTISDYFVDEITSLIYAPEVLDIALVTDKNVITNPTHQKGYLMMEVLPQNTGTKIFADERYQKWEYQKPYLLDIFRAIDALMKKNIAITDLKPDNTLYDVDTRSATIIDVGGSVYAEDLTRFKGSFQFTENFAAPEMISMQKGDIIDLYKAISYMCGRLLEEVTVITDFDGTEVKRLAQDLKLDRILIETAMQRLSIIGDDSWREKSIFPYYISKVKDLLKRDKSSISINEDIDETTKLYIPLNVTTLNPERYKDLATEDLLKKLDHFFISDTQVMLLLGSAGSGKSIVLQQKFIEAVNNWQSGKPLPIYFNLANNIDLGKILHSLDQELNTNISNNIKGKPLILYIDSFDEGLGIKDQKETLIKDYIRTLTVESDINVKDKNIKILISCRSDYLHDDNDEWFKPESKSFEKCFITPINYNENANWGEYIKKRCIAKNDYAKHKFYLDKIQRTGLKDSISTGYLFHMTMEVLESNKGEFSMHTTKHDIYQAYTDNYIERNIGKLNKEQSKSINRSFNNDLSLKENITELGKDFAKSLHVTEEFRIKENSEWFKKFEYRPSITLQHQKIWHTFRCLPLKIETKHTDNKYNLQQKVAIGFIHDTIKNHFLLQTIKDELKQTGKSKLLSARSIVEDTELIKFIGDAIEYDRGSKLTQCLQKIIEVPKTDKSQEATIAANNAIAILGANKYALSNPFNQAKNFKYKYSNNDIDILARSFMKGLNKKSGTYLALRNSLKLDPSKIESIINKGYKFFGIYAANDNHYISYHLYNKQGILTCEYKNSLGTKVESVEQDLQELDRTRAPTKTILLENVIQDQYTKSSSAIFALKNLQCLIDNSNHFYTPKTLKEINP